MSDEYEEAEFEEEDFQEAPEAGGLQKYEEIVFCPDCDLYMPYKVEGAIVRRRCPKCGKEFEGGMEVTPGAPSRPVAATHKGKAVPPKKPTKPLPPKAPEKRAAPPKPAPKPAPVKKAVAKKPIKKASAKPPAKKPVKKAPGKK